MKQMLFLKQKMINKNVYFYSIFEKKIKNKAAKKRNKINRQNKKLNDKYYVIINITHNKKKKKK